MEYDDVMVGLNKTRSEVRREPLDGTNGKWEGSPLNGRQVPENLRILEEVALEQRQGSVWGAKRVGNGVQAGEETYQRSHSNPWPRRKLPAFGYFFFFF